MIDVNIPNDIADYKPKLMFGLTGKQVFCILVTFLVILLEFHFLKPFIGDLTIALAAVPAFFAACFGWGEKFTPGHVPFEKYMRSVLFQSLMAPKNRRMRHNDASVIPCDKFYEPLPDSALDPEFLAYVEQVRATMRSGGDGGTEAKRAKKYRKSKQAFL